MEKFLELMWFLPAAQCDHPYEGKRTGSVIGVFWPVLPEGGRFS